MIRHAMTVSLLCLFAASASAQAIKCTDPKTGKVTYSDRVCATGSSAKSVSLTDNTTDSTHARRDIAIDRYMKQQAEFDRMMQGGSDDSLAVVGGRGSIKPRYSTSNGTTPYKPGRFEDPHASNPTKPSYPIPEAEAPRPTPIITKCNGGTCYDNQGGVYYDKGNGTMATSKGGFCRMVGNTCR